MSKQPEALRLADALQSAVQTYAQTSEDEPGGYCRQEDQLMDDSAYELRRLHAINAELVEALKECVEDSEQAVSDYLQKYGTNYRPERLTAMSETVAKARSAIAKAEGREA